MEDRRSLAGNTATGVLKLIALALMLVDHAGKMLFPGVLEMRMLGRMAFPLYCWCLVVGFHYTRSVPKYLLRIGLTGLISQPLYMLALNHTWREPNVFLTLLLGLCALWGIREKRWYSHLWAPAAALELAVTDAQAKAEVIASAAGRELGGILTISQGSEDDYSYYNSTAGSGMFYKESAAMDGAATTVRAAQIRVNAQVQISYELN